MTQDKAKYGVGPASYVAAGEEPGIRALVDRFYHYMDTLPEAAVIRAMHPKDLTVARDKLTLFLCGWMNGPKLFAAKYKPTPIPRFHAKFPIGEAERDAWLLCMKRAVDEQPYEDEFKAYLLRELYVPAERSRQASEAARAG